MVQRSGASIAVIGGGVNGLMASMRLATAGFDVTVFESDDPMSKTSSASTKLLHGGIRYLENLEFSLVRKSLLDRAWWFANAPEHCREIKIHIPVFTGSPRSRGLLLAGALVYQWLSGKYSLGSSGLQNHKTLMFECPEMISEGLLGSIQYYDGQMNEEMLGRWVVAEAKRHGVTIKTHMPVEKINANGVVTTASGQSEVYDLIINATGPWVDELNSRSGIVTEHSLQLIRGSHLMLEKRSENAYLLQARSDGRFVFCMPYLNYTLIGTTEVKQTHPDPVICCGEEEQYLIDVYNSYFSDKISTAEILQKISGVRAVVNNATKDLSSLSREAVIEATGNVVSVFGGKWTSAPSLSHEISDFCTALIRRRDQGVF